MKRLSWFRFLFCFLGTFLCGSVGLLLGGTFDRQGIATENVHAPSVGVMLGVSSLMYFLLSVAIYVVWCTLTEGKGEENSKKVAVILYVCTIVLNLIAMAVIFRFESYVVGFAVMAMSCACLMAMLYFVYRLNRVSTYIALPAFAWVVFLSYLNYLVAFVG